MLREYAEILARNNLVRVQTPTKSAKATFRELVTVLNNVSYYGYGVSTAVYEKLADLSSGQLRIWWKDIEPILRKLTGDDKNMGDFVVYKNFPAEVLEMSEAEYWFKQILMYWGFPPRFFTQEEIPREAFPESLPVRVLHFADENSCQYILDSLLSCPARWKPQQQKDVFNLCIMLRVNLSNISFKENMVVLASHLMEKGVSVEVDTATDVLRLAVAMSDGDFSLRENSRLTRFSRPQRRFMLGLLNTCENIEEDFARRPERFKRLLAKLHPGDFSFTRVQSAYDKLYRGELPATFSGRLEAALLRKSPAALQLLKQRPGEFARRLRYCIKLFGNRAVIAFCDVVGKLNLTQLLNTRAYLATISNRKYRAFPPKGNWGKVKIFDFDTFKPNGSQVRELISHIDLEIADRVKKKVPAIRSLDERLEMVRLQTNDGDLASYGRGTEFPIPDNIKFIRSASYWQQPGSRVTWFDNSWNFFGEDWKPVGTVCWNSTRLHVNSRIERYGYTAAIFSGDPVNTNDIKGRGCQMIDLYIDKLIAAGVRYCVWNILCYSNVKFSEAEDVQAVLMWGEKPQSNKIFDPKRIVHSFPLNGDYLTKYIAYVDLQERKIVFMDVAFSGNVHSATANEKNLQDRMPAYVEYLSSIPSVYDLVHHLPQSEDGVPFLYSDENEEIKDGKAYVFRPSNEANSFEPIDVNSILF